MRSRCALVARVLHTCRRSVFLTVFGSRATQLRTLNPAQKTLTYSVADLQTYVDGMKDVFVMVTDPATKLYARKGKAFIKQQLMNRLKAAVV